MDSLIIQDAFEPCYAVLCRFPVHVGEPRPAGTRAARVPQSSPRRSPADRRFPAESDSATEH